MNISTPLNIGLVDFTPGTGNFTNQTFIVFEGQTVTTNAILVRLTYMDDLVLAGDMAQNNRHERRAVVRGQLTAREPLGASAI